MQQPAGIADLDRQKRHGGHRGDDGAAVRPKFRSGTAENTDKPAALHAPSLPNAMTHYSGLDGDTGRGVISVQGQARRFDPLLVTSGLPRITDIVRQTRLVRLVPRFTFERQSSAAQRCHHRSSDSPVPYRAVFITPEVNSAQATTF